jgi:hypothetical protein
MSDLEKGLDAEELLARAFRIKNNREEFLHFFTHNIWSDP